MSYPRNGHHCHSTNSAIFNIYWCNQVASRGSSDRVSTDLFEAGGLRSTSGPQEEARRDEREVLEDASASSRREATRAHHLIGVEATFPHNLRGPISVGGHGSCFRTSERPFPPSLARPAGFTALLPDASARAFQKTPGHAVANALRSTIKSKYCTGIVNTCEDYSNVLKS